MSEKQFIKNRRVDDIGSAPTPQNTPATVSTLPTPASQAPSIPTIREEDGMSQYIGVALLFFVILFLLCLLFLYTEIIWNC